MVYSISEFKRIYLQDIITDRVRLTKTGRRRTANCQIYLWM